MKNKIRTRKITIRQQPTYQVGTKLYRTRRAAVRAEAWRMICERYSLYAKLTDVKAMRKMTCECWDGDSSGCEIHCRNYGYFARLHKRLARLLLAE